MLAWIVENSEKLKLIVSRDQEISKYIPGLYDFSVTIELDGELVWGRGIDHDETIALTSACAELVERATLYYHTKLGEGWNSKGIAAHTNSREAKDHAVAELLERDAFLSHYLTFVPFFEIEIPASLTQLEESLQASGVKLRLGFAKSPPGWFTSVAVCIGENASKPFGMFVGASAKRDRDQSILKATKEAVALVCGFLRNTDKKMVQEATEGPLYHYRFSSEQLDLAKEHYLFCKTEQNLNHIDLNLIKTDQLKLHPAFEGCPVTVVRATSPDAQQLFFGETKPEHINFKRLSQFLGKEVRWEDVNKTTHVFA